MSTWNTVEQITQKNVAAGTYKFNLRGGSYWVEFNGTGSGTFDLKKLGPDGSTYTARITQITATVGQQTSSLPPGAYEVVIATFTANYFEVTRIPTAIE